MPSLVLNALVEQTLRDILLSEGYALTNPRANGETGVDIVATREGTSVHIECIGFKSSPPARSKDFYESFFRIISRLNEGATRLVIALPVRSKLGLPARARQYREAWPRIAVAFPELEIWLVDTDLKSVSYHTWTEWTSN